MNRPGNWRNLLNKDVRPEVFKSLDHSALRVKSSWIGCLVTALGQAERSGRYDKIQTPVLVVVHGARHDSRYVRRPTLGRYLAVYELNSAEVHSGNQTFSKTEVDA
jgi:hypothetical protein